MNDDFPENKKTSWRYWLSHPELTCSMVILLAFLVLATLQVVSRFVFNLPFVWTEELTSNLIIWMTFLGATAVQREDSHIRVELIENILSRKAVAVIYAFYDLLTLGFLICLIYGGWHTVYELTHEKTPALQIPLKYLFLVIPFSATIMCGYVIKNAWARFKAAAK